MTLNLSFLNLSWYTWCSVVIGFFVTMETVVWLIVRDKTKKAKKKGKTKPESWDLVDW